MKKNAVVKDLIAHQKTNANAEKPEEIVKRIANAENVKIFKDER